MFQFLASRLARMRSSPGALHCTLSRVRVGPASVVRRRRLEGLRVGAAVAAGAVVPVVGANGLPRWAAQDHVRALLAVTGRGRQSTFTV
jgi:hypothetical protein